MKYKSIEGENILLARIWKGYAVFRCIQIQMQNILHSRKIFSKSACQKRHKIQSQVKLQIGSARFIGLANTLRRL